MQILGRDVDVDHLIGIDEHGVGNALAHLDADERFDRVVQAFQVLHVHRGDDVNSGGEEVLHVLVALGVSTAWNVGMRQFIDERDLRLAAEAGVEVELFDGNAVILHVTPRNAFQAVHQRDGAGAAVRFDKTDDDVHAFGFQPMRFLQHLICLAHPRTVPQINFQPSPIGAANQIEKFCSASFGHNFVLEQNRFT